MAVPGTASNSLRSFASQGLRYSRIDPEGLEEVLGSGCVIDRVRHGDRKQSVARLFISETQQLISGVVPHVTSHNYVSSHTGAFPSLSALGVKVILEALAS